MKRFFLFLFVFLAVIVPAFFVFAPRVADQVSNQIIAHQPYPVSDKARQLHGLLIIGDWHADSLLWGRDLSKRNNRGQVDIPRLQDGNVSLQMFTTVTKSPAGLNYEHNAVDAADNITRLAIAQRWPGSTWRSLTARALYQAEQLSTLAGNNSDDLMLIRSKAELNEWVEKRKINGKLIGGLLGTEGSHALDGNLHNIQVLFDYGFRMMSLQHFFDNKLGGSLHGESQTGLTQFGRDAVKKIQELDIILDVSHSSEKGVAEVLAVSSKPVVVSHTGFKGFCDSPRNISDSLMKRIAAEGGLIAVGFWEGAICGTHPKEIAAAIQYGVNLVGEDHVALGSDFDGAVTMAIDSSELVAITHHLLEGGVSESQIRKVMGGNMQNFLARNLPD